MTEKRESTIPPWPSLPLDEWRDTYKTLHMWTQLVGKIHLALSPKVNHWWNVAFDVDARGLTTGLVHAGPRGVELRFDFISHQLVVELTDGTRRTVPLEPRTVASFYGELSDVLEELGVSAHVWTTPVEIPDPIPFEVDTLHSTYVPEHANRYWRVLLEVHRVFEHYRAHFIGKCSPIQLFWGGFDLAITRFSGRRAPEHPAVPNTSPSIVREAYSHEVSSAGFWPGGGGINEPCFFAYAYPEPRGYARSRVEPPGATYSTQLQEWLLPYDVVRRSSSPDDALMAFLESTYSAAADLGHWDRGSLERTNGNGNGHGKKAPPQPRDRPH